MGKLDGKVAIVTGASRGIGKCCALALAREGCNVTVAAKTEVEDEKHPGTIHDAAREIEALGRRALAVRCDVREADQIEAMVAQTVEKLGGVDILVNNAGALWWRPVIDTPPKRFDLVIDVNVRASFIAARACLPTMMQQRSGHIVNMSPPIEMRALPNHVAYLVGKYGMTMLTMGLAEEMREHNIAVNSLWPVTVIESQATVHFGLGDKSLWRKAEILADALVAIVSKDPAARTGQALLDEDVLRAEGVTDFDAYACVPGSTPLRLDWGMATGIGGS
jgi:citronellol/citronellal dehydrogenase